MRKVIIFLVTTLDGFIAGPNAEIDWHQADDEFNEFANHQLQSVDTLLFGRVTYEGMASYWPTPAAIADDPLIAEKMNSFSKIVFSKTLSQAIWHNTRLIKDTIADEITKLKQQTGKDLIIFGSSNLAVAFIQLGLIDEFRIMVSPVAIGNGIPLFAGLTDRLKLRLLKTQTFQSGNVLFYYQPHSHQG